MMKPPSTELTANPAKLAAFLMEKLRPPSLHAADPADPMASSPFRSMISIANNKQKPAAPHTDPFKVVNNTIREIAAVWHLNSEVMTAESALMLYATYCSRCAEAAKSNHENIAASFQATAAAIGEFAKVHLGATDQMLEAAKKIQHDFSKAYSDRISKNLKSYLSRIVVENGHGSAHYSGPVLYPQFEGRLEEHIKQGDLGKVVHIDPRNYGKPKAIHPTTPPPPTTILVAMQ